MPTVCLGFRYKSQLCCSWAWRRPSGDCTPEPVFVSRAGTTHQEQVSRSPLHSWVGGVMFPAFKGKEGLTKTEYTGCQRKKSTSIWVSEERTNLKSNFQTQKKREWLAALSLTADFVDWIRSLPPAKLRASHESCAYKLIQL